MSSSVSGTGLREIIYLSETVPATTHKKTACDIFAPDAAYDAYCTAFGTTYAPYIRKLSEYNGTLPTYE